MKYLQAENIHFNLSHSGNLVICAVGEKAVGCDIEKTGKEPEGMFITAFEGILDFHALVGGGYQQEKSVPLWYAFRRSGTSRCGAYHTCGGICGSAFAISFKLCSRSHGLCGSGRTDSGDVGR